MGYEVRFMQCEVRFMRCEVRFMRCEVRFMRYAVRSLGYAVRTLAADELRNHPGLSATPHEGNLGRLSVRFDNLF